MKKITFLFAFLFIAFAPMKALAQFPTTLWADNADIAWYEPVSNDFTISEASQLAGLAQLVEAGNNFSGKTITLTANLDLGANLWKPIGKNSALTFSGTFDGANYTISNLFVVNSTTSFTGLFGQITNATVKNIILQNPSINAKDDAGCIAGGLLNNALVENCHAIGVNMVGTGANIGGLVGSLLGNSTVSRSSSSGSVSGINQIGGVVGSPYNFADISECYSEGTVSGSYFVGGIAGYSAFAFQPNRFITVNNCYSRANIIATEGPAGGIFGGSSAVLVVKNSYATGSITSPGIIGGVLGEISNVNAVNNFWDVESTGTTEAIGSWNGNITPFEITGKTTAEMKSADLVALLNQNQGTSPWSIDESKNDGYPILDSNSLKSATFNLVKSQVSVYPTVVSNVVTISATANLIDAKLYSITGNLVQSTKLSGLKNTVDVNGIGAGIYLLVVKTDKGSSTHKIIKK